MTYCIRRVASRASLNGQTVVELSLEAARWEAGKHSLAPIIFSVLSMLLGGLSVISSQDPAYSTESRGGDVGNMQHWKLLGHAEIHLEFGPRTEGGVCTSACFFIMAHMGISSRRPGRIYSRGEKVELPHSPCTD